MVHDYLVVGAGFAGAVCAQRLAEAGKTVLVIDKRNHIGGNAYDEYDPHGILIHPYGPHIFHTSKKPVFEYLSRFTGWRFYEHRVLAVVDGTHYPIPINRTTINNLYGLNLSTDDEVAAYLENVREKRDPIRTSEDVVINSVGRDLCDKFFRGYTKKQWGLDLSELAGGVAARIPTRTNEDDRYFTDTYQFMPIDGYTCMFQKMLDNQGITIRLSTSLDEAKHTAQWKHMIYTGPVDAFFDYCFGPLPYRSLSFTHENLADENTFQPTGTVNYPNDHEFTRITEFKYLTGQQCSGTSIVREYPQQEGEPYYPIPRPENEALYKKYAELVEKRSDVTFVGRLAQYRYYNMDQVVEVALEMANRLLGKECKAST